MRLFEFKIIPSKNLKTAIIGLTKVFYDKVLIFQETGHQISCIHTTREAPEFIRNALAMPALQSS